MPDIDIGWKVKLDELQSQLRASGALSNTEIRKLVGEMQSQFKKAESAAAKSAKNAAKEWDKGLGSLKGIAEKTAGMLGGTFGTLGDLVLDVGEKFAGAGGAIGVMGASVGVAVTGMVALGVAAVEVAAAADDAAKRLTEAGHAALISPEARASLEEYREGTSLLRTEVDVLTVSLGADLAGAVGGAAEAMGYFLDRIAAVKTEAGDMADVLESRVNTVLRVLVGVSTGGMSEVARLVRESIEGNAQTLSDTRQMQAEMAKATETYKARELKARQDVAGAIDKETGAVKKHVGALKEEQAALLPITETEAEREARNNRFLELSAKIAKQDADAAAAKLTALQAEATFRTDLDKMVAESSEKISAIATNEIDRRRSLAQDALQSTSDLAGAMSSAISKAAEDGTVSQKQAALTLFRVSQATAIAASAVDAIRAGVSLIPGFAFLGPGAPAAAAATAAAAFATASAGILSQSPPSFQRGGMVATPGSTPDHRVIQTRADEAVLTGRGVRALGGPSAVEAVNRGGTAQAQPTIVNLHVDGRKLATARVDPLGSLLTGAPLGRRPLYG